MAKYMIEPIVREVLAAYKGTYLSKSRIETIVEDIVAMFPDDPVDEVEQSEPAPAPEPGSASE